MIGAAGILSALTGHAAAAGWFDKVFPYEPKAAPGPGLSVSFWVSYVGPAQGRSGLSSTSSRVEVHARLMLPMLAEPQDATDPRLVDALDGLMRAYSGDLELGGVVADVDLLGAHGEPLSAKGGYLEQDRQLYRCFDLTIPVIVNDLWEQTR